MHGSGLISLHITGSLYHVFRPWQEKEQEGKRQTKPAGKIAIVKKFPDPKRFKHREKVLIFAKYIIFVSRRSKNQPYT